MKSITINGRLHRLIGISELDTNPINRIDTAVELQDGRILPIIDSPYHTGICINDGELFDTIVTKERLNYGPIMELPIASGSDNIKDIIKEHEQQRDLEKEEIQSAGTDNIYVPVINGNESVEMAMLKKAIGSKHIDLNAYESKFNGKFQNDKRLLNKNTISLDKLKAIAEALDLSIEMTIRDKDGDILAPMNTEYTGVITEDGGE